MGTGYTRNDTSDNIASGKVVNASDLDGEYDAIEAAFDETTGHTHDGTSAEGGPVSVVGPAQEYVGDGTSFSPKTDDTYDLGTASLEWKDLYIDGTAYVDTLSVTTAIGDWTVSGEWTFNGNPTIANSTPFIQIRDSDGVSGSVAKISVNAAGSLRLRSDPDDVTGSSQLEFEVDGTRVADMTPTGLNSCVIGATTPAAATVTDLSITAGDIALAGGDIEDVGAIYWDTSLSSGDYLEHVTANGLRAYENGTLIGRIGSGGNVSLLLSLASDTTASAANVYANPSTGGLYRSTSSGEFKINRAAIADSGGIIDALEPVTFDSTHEGDAGVRFAGFIAEDVEACFPEASTDSGKNYDVRALVSVLVAEVQSLRARVEELENT